MRLIRLDLIRYGHFTDASLEFEPGFNLVYGPNEAGKSTTLRALRQLLFGFDHKCSDGFLHPSPSLRIGAVLEDEQGERLECLRLKKQHDSLRGFDDATILPEECLQRLLDGMEEAEFRQRFGIDYEQLVAGGREICAGQGDLGEILFAAASGIAALGQVQEKLAAEAGELFKPSGSKPAINQLLAQLRELRGEIKQLQLPAQDWEVQEQRLRESHQQLAQVNELLREKMAEQRKLVRLQAALPLVAKRTVLRAEAQRLAAVPLLPDDFSDRRQKALADYQTASDARDVVLQEIAARTRELERLPGSDAILPLADRIRELQTEYGGYRKAQHDRPQLTRDLERLEAGIRATLRELGRAESLDELANVTVTRQVQMRIQRLALLREQQLTQRQGLDARHKELSRKRAAAEQQLNALPAAVAADELHAAVQAYRTRGAAQQQLAELRTETETRARELESELQRLGLARHTPDSFAGLPLPTLTTIDYCVETANDLHQQRARLDDRIRETQEQLAALQLRIHQLRLEEDVPTQEDLDAARQTRDEAWQWVQKSWRLSAKEDRALGEFLSRAAGGDTVEAAFEYWLQRADKIADRLRREAHRVADKAKCLADQQAAQHTLEQQRREADALQQRIEEHEQQWQELWRELPVTVRSPREMRAWRESAERVLLSVQQYCRQRDRLAPLEHEVQQLRDRLQGALRQHAARCSPAAEVDELAALAEQIIKKYEEAERRRTQLLRDLETLTADEQELADGLAENEQAQRQWQGEWASVMEALALGEASLPEEVQVVVETTKDVLARHREAETLRERIAGIDADAERFENELRALLEPYLPELKEAAVEVAIGRLSDRLEAAQTAATRRAEMEKQLARDQQRHEQIEQRRRRAAMELEILCKDAGGVAVEQLAQVEQQARERALVLRQGNELEAELQHLAGSEGVTTLVAAAEQLDRERVAERLEELARAIPPLEEQRDALNTRVGEQQTELARMDGRAAAAEKQEEVATIIAATRGRIEQYLRLRFAAAVLRETVDRYRGKHQTPVLRRASELFATLTLGNFTQLRVDSGDRGQPVLVGVRPDGKVVHVEGMSTGASDQLYLALRVASLEHYFSERRPMPFIIDDVLIMFDDLRAAAALQVFAELAKQTQVIFFTHHQHLLDVAAATLSSDAYRVLHLETTEGEPVLP